MVKSIFVYLIASFFGHLIWEIGHLPLYTLWYEESLTQAFSILHCTFGDLLIALFSLVISIVLLGKHKWPNDRFRIVGSFTLIFGLSYTIFSEWLNVSVRQSWAYNDYMPLIPPFDTGLTPLLQWIAIPFLALFFAKTTYVKEAPSS